jgi:hypothetical protein
VLNYRPPNYLGGQVRRAFLFALLLASCKKDDPLPPAGCNGPDFDVLIAALDVPLPADTVVRVKYAGGQMEEYRLADRETPQVLFCEPTDREGNPPGSGGHGGHTAAAPSAGGEGGAASGGGVEAIRCTLWTDSSATLIVETSLFPTVETELSAKKGKCTVSAEILVGPGDAGAD